MTNLTEHTRRVWNPMTGCTKLSPGCDNCYVERIASRLSERYFDGEEKYHSYALGFTFREHLDRLLDPYYLGPSILEVNSMSDLFHENATLEFQQMVFKAMNECPHILFQVLTKRPERVLELADNFNFTPNIWLGTSVAVNGSLGYIEHLRQVPAAVRFVAFEPLLELIQDVNLDGIHWVTVGGESPGWGNAMRACELEWISRIVQQCDEQKVAVFIKQLGGFLGKKMGMVNAKGFPDLKGGEFEKFPLHLQRREYPIDVDAFLSQWVEVESPIKGTFRKWISKS
ncbi:MAG: DUF5131 family protein [Saprospiraceae bacterium]|nr:DUF5131 family protein [Saprospiraceae bacterium]